MIKRAGLFDGSFTHLYSASVGGDNVHLKPEHITWIRDQHLPTTFYTDMCLDEVENAPDDELSIAWLLEPPSISDTHYHRAFDHLMFNSFDYILTFMQEFVELHEKVLYYPLGGTWIDKAWQGLLERYKIRDFSLITTQKQRAEGHKLRHRVCDELADQFDIAVYGRGSDREMVSKKSALDIYRFSIVIESCRVEDYFSEKLIDCLSMGTIPIYWGCPNIGSYFEEQGLFEFETIEQLEVMLEMISANPEYIYDEMKRWASVNYYRASDYMIVEDNIFLQYPYLFR